MQDRAAKEALFDAFAAVAKALASGRRAEIVDVLAQGPRSVDELSRQIGQSVANTSHHLQALAAGGLVRTTREGTRVIYRLAGPAVVALWRALRDVAAAHVGELERLAQAYLGGRDGIEPVPLDELSRRLGSGGVVVLDVRPAAEFAAGHIEGARSIPIEELSRRLKELPKSKRIIAYCRGPYCVFADDAVRLLRSKGFSATRMADGFPEWRDAGLPVTSGTARPTA
ncbi:MAG TPA: metalloregulator ArsR/SmtB family transcription factor [Actinomycetota bacterium]|nr:metalloregulator ArsR/SmtB family transcription factor [Actinomycetota bacterium]